METQKRIGVGFGIVVRNRKGEFLLGKRHDDPAKARSALHGEGTWTFPGGKLKFGERLQQGAARELKEEIGADVLPESLKVCSFGQDIMEDAHFITFGLVLEGFEGEAHVMEPDEITQWQWFAADAIPSNLFSASQHVLKAYLSGEFAV